MMTHPHAPLPDNDDEPVGRVFSRREFLSVLAAAGGTLTLAACAPAALAPPAQPASAPAAGSEAAPAMDAATSQAAGAASPVDCLVSPAQGQGPFFVDEGLNRSDIRSDPATGAIKEGTLLTLALAVAQVQEGACTPLAGALVDVWHCDADGVYSAFNDGRSDARGDYSLRGQQVTDQAGRVTFTTIYPGWYPGRAVHIHFKVRHAAEDGQTYEFTSQLYFDDAFTDQVFAAQPYAARGERNTRNDTDGLFRNGGEQLILRTELDGDGIAAAFTVGMVA